MGINQQQALDCFASDDLIGIGMEADAVRRRLHPEGVVSYAVDRVFEVESEAAAESLLAGIGDAVAEGATTIRIVGSSSYANRDSISGALSPAALENVLTTIRLRFPSLLLESLSAAEVRQLAATAGLGTEDVLLRLRDAGLDAIAGSPAGVSPEEWIGIHRTAHRAGLRSSACLSFGGGETPEETVEQLFSIRGLQEETGGFTAFSLAGFRPNTPRAEFEEPTAVEYLRTLAIARMALESVENVESSCVKEGLKVMQMALRFGANDGGAIGVAGNSRFTEADLRRVIRDAGFTPVERDSLYRTMFLNN
jgi:cyclic dehypoxanthinyl futalosine synthase